MYEITFHGDLEGTSPIYSLFTDALGALATEWCLAGRLRERFDVFGIKHYESPFIPDPEDDRVVIWEITEGQHKKVVWHFSGWHWAFDASDLPGGPLDQGNFSALDGVPSYWAETSLYEMAMADY